MNAGNLSPGQFNADEVIAPDVGRVTAKKDNTLDTLRLAIFHSNTTGKPQHVYQTHYGWEVDSFPALPGRADWAGLPGNEGYPLGRDLRGGRGDLPRGSEDQGQPCRAAAETGA